MIRSDSDYFGYICRHARGSYGRNVNRPAVREERGRAPSANDGGPTATRGGAATQQQDGKRQERRLDCRMWQRSQFACETGINPTTTRGRPATQQQDGKRQERRLDECRMRQRSQFALQTGIGPQQRRVRTTATSPLRSKMLQSKRRAIPLSIAAAQGNG